MRMPFIRRKLQDEPEILGQPTETKSEPVNSFVITTVEKEFKELTLLEYKVIREVVDGIYEIFAHSRPRSLWCDYGRTDFNYKLYRLSRWLISLQANIKQAQNKREQIRKDNELKTKVKTIIGDHIRDIIREELAKRTSPEALPTIIKLLNDPKFVEGISLSYLPDIEAIFKAFSEATDFKFSQTVIKKPFEETK